MTWQNVAVWTIHRAEYDHHDPHRPQAEHRGALTEGAVPGSLVSGASHFSERAQGLDIVAKNVL